MKKTITLLLAAASMAMGAEKMNWDWDTNTESYNGSQVSAVFTLDLNAIKTAEYDNNPLLTFNVGYKTYGIMSYYEPGYGWPDYLEIALYDPSISYGSYAKSINSYSSAVVGYTYDSSQGSKMYLALIDAEGNAEPVSSSGWYGAASDGLVIDELNKNACITQIDVYNAALSDEDMLYAMTFPSDGPNTPVEPSEPAVPEPTTATLSLLALAGLAARRRRR
ncbi:MAG: PEP-CTERM sorting domain-containing protein [Akkermansia sp.]|nr:PEP-CTERM sorting domain-containing protein [Akkermansia sp.]